ncbi:MAG: endonuclease/exonuclease/phosphatase family protein [Armatimonadetes bacterium]|nr:endonuclease/exonuclease/phosphatase family protein [Armatimonadota bacterium]
MKKLSWFIPLLALGVTSSCAFAQQPTNNLRVMTYNIYWFAEDSNPERIANVKQILDTVKPNIVALEEIQSKKALEQIFDSKWSIGMADDPKEYQEPCIAVKAPYKLVKSELLFTSPALNFAFPGGRDVLRAEVLTPKGTTLVFYVCHLKSRRGGRWITDQQRELAAGMLAGYIAGQKNENSIVLGDMNDTPDDRSMNILETGNLLVKGGQESVPNPLMVNLCEPLYRKNYVSLDLDRLFKGQPLAPVVMGAYQSNEELRGKEHKFPDDVKVVQTLFDQILVSPNLFPKHVKTDIYSGAEALRGSGSKVKVVEEPYSVTYTEMGTKASDHLPVFADFNIE